MTKTYKREFAGLLCIVWLGFCIWAVYEPRAFNVAMGMTWPVLALAAAAFGMDSLAKQFGDR